MVLGAKTNGTTSIGIMLNARRKELKMTLQQLADKSGLSAPFISQAERNQTVPSMVSLVKLASALSVDLKYFMEVPHDGSIVHRHNELPVIDMDSPVTYFQMSSDLTNQQMDAILMRIPAGHAFPVDQREGEDLLYVLEGELYAEVGDVKTTLVAGDSMHFKSSVVHTAINKSDKDVLLLYVGTPSIF